MEITKYLQKYKMLTIRILNMFFFFLNIQLELNSKNIRFVWYLQGVKGAPYYVGAAQTLPRGMYSDRNKNIIGKLKSQRKPFMFYWSDVSNRIPTLNTVWMVFIHKKAWKIWKVFENYLTTAFENWFM